MFDIETWFLGTYCESNVGKLKLFLVTGASSVIRGLAYPPVSGHWNDRKHESFGFLVVSIGLGSTFSFYSFLDPFSSGQPACPSLDSGCWPGNRKDAGDLRKVYGDFNFVKKYVKHILLCQNVRSFRRIWGQFRRFFNQPPALVLIFSLGWDPWQETLHTNKVHSGAQETETRWKWCKEVGPSQSRE